MKKSLFLGAILLFTSIRMYAQQVLPDVKVNAVGIETTEPHATLDVNGNTRIQNIKECTDCNWLLVTGSNKIVQKVQVYSATEKGSFSKAFTRQKQCPEGKRPPQYIVSKELSETATSIRSREDAAVKAKIRAMRKAQSWVYENGQDEADKQDCLDGYTATETGSYQKFFSKRADLCPYSNMEGIPYLVESTATATYESPISMEDAREKARAKAIEKAKEEVDAKGQTEANNLGSCRYIVRECEETESVTIQCLFLNYSPAESYDAIQEIWADARGIGTGSTYDEACSSARDNAIRNATEKAEGICESRGGYVWNGD